ncbi:hypothetical protein MJA45_24865 [Paenibacillus aurantius]|uniref:O-antigen ligase domain-containing protein n=1 Tax=Paenibacillus aurantius TaxID=2918900 RepID=A0AA96RH67_9BACL|nr:hypothetical protein [Paenibacillus aurantius]WNQ10814.1 hypothetical protein MJA45_24865 [Paenibacillus aurantius]
MLVERVRIPSLLAGFLALGVLAALRPDYVLLLPAAALALVFLFSWRAAVYLLLVAVTFNRLSFNVSSTNLRPEMLAVLIGAAAALLFWLSRNKWQNDVTVRFTFGAPSIAIALFFVYTYIVSYWNSPVFSYSVAGMIQLALASMGFFVMTQVAGFDRNRIHSYVGFYIGLTVFQSVYALLCFLYNKTTGQFLFGEKYGGLMTGQISGVDWSSITWRGGLYEANLFSAYLGAGIVFLVTVIVARVQPRQTPLLFLGMLLAVVGIVMGWTRSAWIGTALGVAFTSLFYVRKWVHPRNVVLFGGLAAALVPIFVFVESIFDQTSGRKGLLTSKLMNLFNSEEGTGKFRAEKFQFAWDNWLNGHPIAGNGYFSIKVYNPDEWVTSMFLAILHDSGLIGLCLFVFAVGYVFFYGLRAALVTSDAKHRAYLLGMVGGLLVLLLSYNFSPGHTLAMFWVHLGLIYALASKERIREGEAVHER